MKHYEKKHFKQFVTNRPIVKQNLYNLGHFSK